MIGNSSFQRAGGLLLVLLLILSSSLHQSSTASAAPTYGTTVDLDEIDSFEVEDDVSGHWSGTIKLVANNIPMGLILSKFNTTIGTAVILATNVDDPRNMTDGVVYKVTAEQELIYPLTDNTFAIALAGSFDLIGTAGEENGGGITHTLGPCSAYFLRNTFQNVQASYIFQSNVTLSVDVELSYDVLDTSVRNNQTLMVPDHDLEEYITYVPVNESYDLTLVFDSTESNIVLSDRLIQIDVGCDNVRTIMFTELNVTEWNITLVGLKGPAFMKMMSTAVGSEDIKMTFVESRNTAHKGDDEKLKTWQIILIAVAGAVTVGIVSVIVVIIIALIYRSKRGYVTLN